MGWKVQMWTEVRYIGYLLSNCRYRWGMQQLSPQYWGSYLLLRAHTSVPTVRQTLEDCRLRRHMSSSEGTANVWVRPLRRRCLVQQSECKCLLIVVSYSNYKVIVKLVISKMTRLTLKSEPKNYAVRHLCQHIDLGCNSDDEWPNIPHSHELKSSLEDRIPALVQCRFSITWIVKWWDYLAVLRSLKPLYKS